MICCPMTNQLKGYPFEVRVDIDGVTSAVLSDQIKSLDWKARRAKKKATVPAEVLTHVRALLKALIATA
jgi:mRNA interferase MazF